MKSISFLLTLLYIAIISCMVSCDKTPEGYIEVRNQSNFVIENVSWGKIIDLGTIKPNEENGEETEIVGSKFVYLRVNNQNYRLKDEIAVDAYTSATLIVKDTANLVNDIE